MPVIIGEILDANMKWDRGREVNNAKDSFAIIIGGIIAANKKWDRGEKSIILLKTYLEKWEHGVRRSWWKAAHFFAKFLSYYGHKILMMF